MSGRKIIGGFQEAINHARQPIDPAERGAIAEARGHNFGPTVGDDLVAEAIEEAFGERCPDFEPACYCCQAWAQYDALKGGDASAVRGAIAEWSYRNPKIPWADVSEAGKQQYISMARRIIEAAKEEWK